LPLLESSNTRTKCGLLPLFEAATVVAAAAGAAVDEVIE